MDSHPVAVRYGRGSQWIIVCWGFSLALIGCTPKSVAQTLEMLASAVVLRFALCVSNHIVVYFMFKQLKLAVKDIFRGASKYEWVLGVVNLPTPYIMETSLSLEATYLETARFPE